MADVVGPRGVTQINQDQRRIDMAEEILLLEPNAAPLTVFSKRIDRRPTGNSEFKWMDTELNDRLDAVNNAAGYTQSDTAIVVDTPDLFHADDLVLVTRTGEVMRVTAVDSATSTLTVVRGVGGGAAAIQDDDELLIIGTDREEGSDARDAVSKNPVTRTSYTQIITRTVGITGTALASRNQARPHDWNLQRRIAGIEHAKDIENAFLFAKPNKTVSNGRQRTTTGGYYHWVTDSTDAGGTLTEDEFFTFCRQLFRYGGKIKLGMASGLVVDVLNGFARGKLEVRQDEKTYGVAIMRYISPHGTLNVVKHDGLEGAEFGGHLVGVDLQFVAYRWLESELESRDTHIRENIQERRSDKREDEYFTECGLELRQPKAHRYLEGVTG